MKTKLLFLVALAILASHPIHGYAQESSGSDVERAKQISTMSGRPILAVAGEAAN